MITPQEIDGLKVIIHDMISRNIEKTLLAVRNDERLKKQIEALIDAAIEQHSVDYVHKERPCDPDLIHEEMLEEANE